ncbi:MAG: hypothetical protein WCH46_00940 [bacterium]
MQIATTTQTLRPASDPYAVGLFIQRETPVQREQELSSRQINHYIRREKFAETGYGTTTFGHIGFNRVEPEQVTEDVLLQARLDLLCDKMRAKY